MKTREINLIPGVRTQIADSGEVADARSDPAVTITLLDDGESLWATSPIATTLHVMVREPGDG